MGLAHLRLRIGGQLYSDAHHWSVGLNFRSVTGGDPGALDGMQAKLESWRDAIRALRNGSIVTGQLLNLLSSSGTIDTVRCSSVGADGKEDAVALLELTSGIQGTGTAGMPPQVCQTISLRTGRPGSSYRGRVYWPALGSAYSADSTGQAQASGLAQAFAYFIQDVQNAGASILNPGVRAVVLSTVKSVGTPITQVAVGDQLDIQRRRSQGEQESYSVTSVAE